jgi:hypothetical protein
LKNGKPPPNLPEGRNVEGDRRKIEERLKKLEKLKKLEDICMSSICLNS